MKINVRVLLRVAAGQTMATEEEKKEKPWKGRRTYEIKSSCFDLIG